MFGWAVAACIAACVDGYTGVLIRKHAADLLRGIAAMSCRRGRAHPPAAPFFLPRRALLLVSKVLALGLLCGAVGFLMLAIADTGATTRTVVYLIPPFGILRGMRFLGGTLPPGALAVAVLILAGTVFVTRG